MEGENNNEQRPLSNEDEEQAEWDHYFMGFACLAAQRSKDPCSQVGACIVKNNIFVSSGYNGMPMGCSDDEFPWTKNSPDPLENKHLYVCHAELNAYINTYNTGVRGATIYVSLFPCNECSKMIIQTRIAEVVYLSDKHSHKIKTIASKRMLQKAGVKVRQFIPKRDIIIDFNRYQNSMPQPSVTLNNNEEIQTTTETAENRENTVETAESNDLEITIEIAKCEI